MSSSQRSNKKRKTAYKRVPEDAPLSSNKSTASRKLGVTYEASLDKRTHAIEYGDGAAFACGAVTYQHDHIAKCGQCDAFRFIMDTWQKYLDDTYGTDDRRFPPALTLAGTEVVLKKMGVSWEDVRAQVDSWNPSKPFRLYNKARGRMVDSDKTLLEAWNEESGSNKAYALRPNLPMMPNFLMDAKNSALVTEEHRRLMTAFNAMEFVLRTAVADGVLNQEYVNMCLENFGIFGEEAAPGDVKVNSDASGMDVTLVAAYLTFDDDKPLESYDPCPIMSVVKEARVAQGNPSFVPVEFYKLDDRLGCLPRRSKKSQKKKTGGSAGGGEAGLKDPPQSSNPNAAGAGAAGAAAGASAAAAATATAGGGSAPAARQSGFQFGLGSTNNAAFHQEEGRAEEPKDDNKYNNRGENGAGTGRDGSGGGGSSENANVQETAPAENVNEDNIHDDDDAGRSSVKNKTEVTESNETAATENPAAYHEISAKDEDESGGSNNEEPAVEISQSPLQHSGSDLSSEKSVEEILRTAENITPV